MAAAPGQLLRLASALGSAPEMPDLGFAKERLDYYAKAADEVLGTGTVKALVNDIGDALKSMGIEATIDGIADSLKFKVEPERLLRDFLPSMNGFDLSNMLPDVRTPETLGDAVKIEHDLDVKTARGWLRVSIDVPVPQSSRLFSSSIFEVRVVDSRITGATRSWPRATAPS